MAQFRYPYKFVLTLFSFSTSTCATYTQFHTKSTYKYMYNLHTNIYTIHIKVCKQPTYKYMYGPHKVPIQPTLMKYMYNVQAGVQVYVQGTTCTYSGKRKISKHLTDSRGLLKKYVTCKILKK